MHSPGKNEHSYSNIECGAPGILHGLGKFHHYSLVREVCIITDHKPLVMMLSKDVVMLSQWLQHIMLRIHQYRVYKPGRNKKAKPKTVFTHHKVSSSPESI